MEEPDRRRRRPAISCTICRRRKVKCNREKPCSNCLKSDPRNCTYESQASQPVRQRIGRHSEIRVGQQQQQRSPSINRPSDVQESALGPQSNGLAKATAAAGLPSAWDVDSMKDKISQLEKQLAQTNTTLDLRPLTPTASAIEASSSSLGGTWFVLREEQNVRPTVRCVTHKTRHFGRSHWINSVTLFKDLIAAIEPLLREGTYPVIPTLQKAKALSKVIKAQRRPGWPTVMSSELPSKEICDDLVNCYLGTVETVHRVIHVPSFKKDYDALWNSESKADSSFLILLKLMLAIGAASHDDSFSLRTSAIRWVYEAQTWIAEPNTKHQLNLQGLQIHILLLFGREIVDVGGDSVYVAVGDLFRRAIIMGLHRDPTCLPQKSVLVTEMRRRIWNTILEICLQSSLTSGAPPFFSFDDFDTEPPSNFDDDQLGIEGAAPKPFVQYTDVSIALSLRKILPIRLAVTRLLNDLHSACTYEETLRLDAEMRKTFKEVTKVLQLFKSDLGLRAPVFAFEVVDFIMQRYLGILHIPFFGPALEHNNFAFSRKVVIETSLKIWYLMRPSSSSSNIGEIGSAMSSNSDALPRLATCGASSFRLAAHQACLVIAAELKAQLQEDDGLGPTLVRPDLLAALRDGQSWKLHCIEMGETNIKGYLMSRMIMAQIDGLMQGIGPEKLPYHLVKAAVEAQNVTLPILEQFAQQDQFDGVAEGQHLSYSTPSDVDWDLMMTGLLFDVTNSDTAGFMPTDGAMPGVSFW